MAGKMDELRARIAAELDRREWSRRKASIAAGLSESTLANFLNTPTRGMDPDTCRAVAQLFGWSEDEVLELAGHRSRSEADGDLLADLRDVLRRGDWPPELRDGLYAVAAESQALARAASDARVSEAEWRRRVEEAWEYATQPHAAYEQISRAQWERRVRQRFMRRLFGDLR